MRKLAKFVGVWTLFLVVGRVVWRRLRRLYRVIHLFDPDRIVGNFLGMDKIFPTKTVHKPAQPYHLKRGAVMVLPESFVVDGVRMNSAEFLTHTVTTGLLVLKNDQIVFEQYYQGHSETTRHISWSVAKSFVSALFGIALKRGLIRSIEETVTDYLPAMRGTGYDGVRIKDVLQMSSGVRFDEDYGAFGSDINRFGRLMALGGSLDKFATTLTNERPPGTYNHYVSIDTQVLAMILRQATGMDMTQLLQQWLWQPLGMEHDAYWVCDDKGVALALGGLNATLRDYARFGRLYLHNGNWNGTQIVPADWVKASLTPDAPHLQRGVNNLSESNLGYGFQWWLPDGARGDFNALGIYNQFIYIDPSNDLVIVKQSANHHYIAERDVLADQTFAFFRAIAEEVQG